MTLIVRDVLFEHFYAWMGGAFYLKLGLSGNLLKHSMIFKEILSVSFKETLSVLFVLKD